jgi:hypothetical protein
VKTAEEQICEAVEAFQDGWKGRALGVFSADADYVDPAAAWSRGRAEIARRPAAGRRLARISIRFLREDVAIVHLGWERPGRRGLLTLVMSRAKDAWRIEAAHDSETSD